MRILIALCLALTLAGCASKFRSYDGPEVTRIVVFKEERRMHLLHGNTVLRSFDFELGFAPVGNKFIEGDGRTPEGRYRIDRRNPNSKFHLSLGISYPNARDVAEARRLGKPPGGDIFIHGTPRKVGGRDDWTWGCIAVTNREIEDIYAMVGTGTVIDIYVSAKDRRPAPVDEALVAEIVSDEVLGAALDEAGIAGPDPVPAGILPEGSPAL